MLRDFIKTVTLTSHHPQINGQIADMVEATIDAMKKLVERIVQ